MLLLDILLILMFSLFFYFMYSVSIMFWMWYGLKFYHSFFKLMKPIDQTEHYNYVTWLYNYVWVVYSDHLVSPSICLSIFPTVCSIYLPVLDLNNFWTKFFQTIDFIHVYTKDVYFIFSSQFIEFSPSYCPLMNFVQVTQGWYSVIKSNFLARNCLGYSSPFC